MRRAKGVVNPKMILGLKFFKLASTSEKMVIPAAVIRQMPRLDKVALRDKFNNIWVVKVDINGDDEWSFKEGWPSFYEDNALRPFDFLFFEYKGGTSCLFDIRILGQNGCDIKRVAKFRIKEEFEVEEIEENDFFSDLNDVDDGDCDDDDDDDGEDYDDGKEDDDDDEDDEDEDYDDDDDDDEDYVQEEKEPKQVCKSKKSVIFKPGLDRPSFVTKIGSRKTELFIPKSIIVNYKLKLPERLFLVDVQGNKWEATVNQWKNGRVCCAGGAWRKLCNVNNIKKDDSCICEFLLEGYKDPCVLVRVLDVPGTSGNAIEATSYKQKQVTDCYGADIFRRGLATRPKNRPFFVSKSRLRRHEIRIPKKVIKDLKLKLPDALFLVDEQGNRWETRVKQKKDGNWFCSGGLRSLCDFNNIKMHDTCICEFFLGTHDPCILVRPLPDTTII